MDITTPLKLNFKKAAALIIACMAWFAIIFQGYLTTGSMGNLFSYFTILTNLLIAVSLTSVVILSNTVVSVFFTKPTVQTAIAVYIFIVALVYNTVLRGIVTLHGWNLLVDTILHVIVPLLYIIYWFIFNPKNSLEWKNGLSWILFPLFYLIYSLIRGTFVHWYPYPFLNVAELGYTKIFLNIALMIAVFFIVGLGFIKLNRSLKSN